MYRNILETDLRHFESGTTGLAGGRVSLLPLLPGQQAYLARYVAARGEERIPPLDFPLLAVHLGGRRVSGLAATDIISMPSVTTLIPPACTTEWQFHGPIDVAILLTAGPARTRLLAAATSIRKPMTFCDAVIPAITRQLVAESSRRDRDDKHCDSLTGALLAHVGLLIERGRTTPLDSQTVHSRYIQNAVATIHKHLSEPLPIAKLAGESGLRPSWFRQLFKQVTGMTVHHYITQQRLERVRELLVSTDLPLSQLAEETGFSSQSHLSDRFARTYGETPSEYRRRR